MKRAILSVMTLLAYVLSWGCGDTWGTCSSDATCPDATCPDATCPPCRCGDGTETDDGTRVEPTWPQYQIFEPCSDLMGRYPEIYHIGPELFKFGTMLYRDVTVTIDGSECPGREYVRTIWRFDFATNEATYIADARWKEFTNPVSMEDSTFLVQIADQHWISHGNECGMWFLYKKYYHLIKRYRDGHVDAQELDPQMLLTEDCYEFFQEKEFPFANPTVVKLFDYNWEKQTFLLGCRYWLEGDPDIASSQEIWDIYILNLNTGEKQVLCRGRYDGECYPVVWRTSVAPRWERHYITLMHHPWDPTSQQGDLFNTLYEVWKWDGEHAKLIYVFPTAMPGWLYTDGISYPYNGRVIAGVIPEEDGDVKYYEANIENSEDRYEWREVEILRGWYINVLGEVNEKYPWLREATGWPREEGFSWWLGRIYPPNGTALFLYDMDNGVLRALLPEGSFTGSQIVEDEEGRPRYFVTGVQMEGGYNCVPWVDLIEQGIIDESGHLIPDPALQER